MQAEQYKNRPAIPLKQTFVCSADILQSLLLCATRFFFFSLVLILALKLTHKIKQFAKRFSHGNDVSRSDKIQLKIFRLECCCFIFCSSVSINYWYPFGFFLLSFQVGDENFFRNLCICQFFIYNSHYDYCTQNLGVLLFILYLDICEK